MKYTSCAHHVLAIPSDSLADNLGALGCATALMSQSAPYLERKVIPAQTSQVGAHDFKLEWVDFSTSPSGHFVQLECLC